MRKTELKRRVPLKRGGPIGSAPKKVPKIPKPKKPKLKVPSVAVLDHLFSQLVRKLAGDECQLHGYTGKPCSMQLQCSHIISRRHYALRWYLPNAIAACAQCHRAQHDHPVQNAKWLSELLGEEHLDALNRLYLTGRKPTPAEKIALAAWMREKLKT